MTMAMMESINVRDDDYLPQIDSSIQEDPSMGSIHEEGITINIPKEAPPLGDKQSRPVSIDVQSILELEHMVIEEVQIT